MVGRAGATMVEETGDMNVKQETSRVAAHFLERLQLSGFLGSFGPDQVTYVALVYTCRALSEQQSTHEIGIPSGLWTCFLI